MVEQVKQANPDIAVFNEALWCRPWKGHVVHYPELFGYPHFFCDTYDGPWGNVILSRHPIVASRRFRIHNRSGLVATIQAPAGRISVATYHPHPSRYPAHKARDFRNLLTGISGPSVICGDFNAISPEDAPDEVALARAFARFSQHPATSSARFIEGGRLVFERLGKMGYRDAIPPPARASTMPTDLQSPDKDSAMRIDHIWVNEAVKVLDGGVLKNPATEQASDHYPVWANLALQHHHPIG